MSDDTTHYKGCGVWNAAHARCCTNDELMEALGDCVEEAYSAGMSDGHPLNVHDRRAAERRRTDLRLYLAEVRRRISLARSSEKDPTISDGGGA